MMRKQLEERPNHIARATSSSYSREEAIETRLQRQEADFSEVCPETCSSSYCF